ncbi:hypothetical protein CBS101457_001949 [Exobasidium rhododendri]|nr:hypothetical protein CBS101457_001949 [Exobasidium rhododendri]
MLIRSIAGGALPIKRLLHSSTANYFSDKGPDVASQASEAGPSSKPISHPPSPPSSKSTTAASTPTPARQAVDAKPSFTTSASAVNAELDKKPLPYLSAPLGVRIRPSSRKLSWSERRDQAFDYDRRLEKRKAIVKEATRGYFSDFHAMRSHGGKTWRAPTTLIKQERSLYFPNISGTSLANSTQKNTADMLNGKVSVICILTSVLSEQHAKSFYEAALEIYQKDRNFQLVQINLQENRLKAYLVSLFLSTLRKQIPEPLQSTYLLSHQNLTTEREDIGLHNKHVGYTFLVGPDEKIRWAAGGFAEREERQALIACTGVLLSRLSEEQNGRK